MIFLCLCNDDMLIIGNEINGVLEIKRFPTSTFKMEDLGLIYINLRIKVKRNSEGYELSETHCVEKVLDKFKHLHFKEVSTPFDHNVKIENNDERVVAQLEYASAFDCLMYLMQCIKPDIAFAVSKMNRFTSNPNSEHWKAIKKNFNYLLKITILAFIMVGMLHIIRVY